MFFTVSGEIPPFSIFSAISEIFVTIGVLYGIISHLKGKPLNWKILGSVLAFEFMVNITYMAGKAAEADSGSTLSTGMKIFFAVHGILSLIMFLVLAAVFILSMVNLASDKETWFRRHRLGSWILVFFWMVSVTTGEAIFVMRYLLKII